MELDITKADLETIGTNSLQGMLLDKGVREPCSITIRFQQSSLGWKHAHDGPEVLLIPEHVPMCLCESIVNLQRQGYQITIEPFEDDEERKS